MDVRPGELVLAERCLPVEERIFRRKDHRSFYARQMAGVARAAIRAVNAVLPLMVSGLLHEMITGQVAIQVDCFRDQGVATRTDRAVHDMVSETGREAHEELHDGGVDLVVRIRSIDMRAIKA